MYKLATKIGLRISTERGALSVEQMWTLTLPQLTRVLKELNKTMKEQEGGDDLSFLDETKPAVDEQLQLAFDISKDIYLTKKAEKDARVLEKKKKEHNQLIMQIIKQKENEELANKSIDDLKKMLDDFE